MGYAGGGARRNDTDPEVDIPDLRVLLSRSPTTYTDTKERIMYDQAFYDDAAERIPPSVFAPLRDTPTPSDYNAMDVPAVVIRFTPGDSTLYEILLARGRGDEAIVVVANMRLVFGVPWEDGAYVHPSYLAGQATHVNALTMMAVAAVANRAISVCHDTGRDAVDLVHEIRGTR